ncbi:serine O-acetyltransferase [Dehalogenimonas alkenigignens]|uniref:serine O-acetyltransferase n=1 Tax=Dehalogenimonas alkenigignens TaxID=1217799 RepID=UPI000D585CFC|nr:serine O-acetyltransferase [Dehalogenimonas alkenigignens]PVV83765.1 serine O-acetyltransferase [Dehalogenimonas alkenigignens]
MFKTIREDIRNVFDKDPAARGVFEVIFCYPGLHALWGYRVFHWFWKIRWHFLARWLSHWTRFLTGIEIHPGATIGTRFFIDHGMGVVIGETSVIGDDVLIYKGVVLGGTSLSKGKRHPTLENNVVIGSNATVLGNITIGEGGRVGAGSVVVKSVPPGSTVVGIPGRVVEEHKPKIVTDLEHGHLPDPVAEAVRYILAEQAKLEKRCEALEKIGGIVTPTDELKEKLEALAKEFDGGGI